MPRLLLAAVLGAATGLWLAADPRPLPGQAASLDAGIRFWQDEAARDPGGALARARLAGAYLERFRHTESALDAKAAEAAARASLALRSAGNLEAHQRLVEALLAQHRFADARRAAEQGVAAAPGQIGMSRLHAEVLLELGEYDAFRRTLGSWERETSSPSVAATLARWRLLEGRADEALGLLGAAAAAADRKGAAPEVAAWFHRKLGDARVAAGRAGEAGGAYRAALARFPGDARSEYALGQLAAGRGDWTAALAHARRAARLMPHPEVVGFLGDCLAGLGRLTEAEREHARVQVPPPEEGIVFDRHLAMFWADHGRELAAAERLARAELQARRDVHAYDTLAWVRYRQGDLAEAAALMEQALALGTADIRLDWHAGLIAAARGDAAAARRHLARALSGGPAFPGAGEAVRLLRAPG